MTFQSLRQPPRIVDLFSGMFIDLPHFLDEDLGTRASMLSTQRSLAGFVQSQSGAPYDKLRLRLSDLDLETMGRWKLIWDRTLAKGGAIEIIRDAGRYFWLPGDSEQDVEAGQRPIGTSQYSLVTPIGGAYTEGAGQYAPGAIGVDPADPGDATRTNLLPNGDFLDGAIGAVPTGWVVDTPSTLAMARSLYFLPNGRMGSCAEFIYKGSGTKTAHCDFTLAGYNATNLPSDRLFFSGLLWAARNPTDSALSLVSAYLHIITPVTDLSSASLTATSSWSRFGTEFNLSSVSDADTTVRLVLSFGDALARAPVQMTELQMEARRYRTAFVPYSTVRTYEDGSRAEDDRIAYVNGLLYRHQMPSWLVNGRWGYSVRLGFRPHWASTQIPASTVVLYQDADVASADSMSALEITATANSITATATLHDGTTVSATKSSFSWSVSNISDITVSFRDWDGSTADSGSLDLYTGATLAASATHSKTGARQGRYFWLGANDAADGHPAGEYTNVALAPVYVDGESVLIGEFHQSAGVIRPDRNSYRAKLDPSASRSDSVQDNTMSLDAQLQEAR